MAKQSTGATVATWAGVIIAGYVGIVYLLPNLLALMKGSKSSSTGGLVPSAGGAYGSPYYAQQAQQQNNAILSALAALLKGQQSGGSGSKGGSGLSGGSGSSGSGGSSSSGNSSLFSVLNSWFGDPTESAQLAGLLANGSTIEDAANAIGEDPREVTSALTGVDVTQDVPTESVPIPTETIPLGDDSTTVGEVFGGGGGGGGYEGDEGMSADG